MTLCLTCRNEHCCIEPDLRKIRFECEYYKPITNADRIRAMTDEELAKWLKVIMECEFCPAIKKTNCYNGKYCRERLRDWLKQEAEYNE